MILFVFLQDKGPHVLHTLPVEDTATLDGVAKGVRMQKVDAEIQAPLGRAGARVLPAWAIVHDARVDHLGLIPAEEARLQIARPVVDDDDPPSHGRGRGTDGRGLLNSASQGCLATCGEKGWGFSVNPFWATVGCFPLSTPHQTSGSPQA